MQAIWKLGFVTAALLSIAFGSSAVATADQVDILLTKGGEAYEKGDIDAAVRYCTEAIRLQPGLAAAYFNRRSRSRKKAISTRKLPTTLRPSVSNRISLMPITAAASR